MCVCDIIYIPIVLGRRKKRKSTLATTLSILLSTGKQGGCSFSVGSTDSDETIGFDISPPILIPSSQSHSDFNKYASFVDIEGINMKNINLNTTDNDDKSIENDDASNGKIGKMITQFCLNNKCILLFCCVAYIEDEDVQVLKSIYENIRQHDKNWKPALLSIHLSSPSSKSPQTDNGFKKIQTMIDKNAKLYTLPHISHEQQKAKDALENVKQQNPLKYLPAQQISMFQPSAEIIKRIIDCQHPRDLTSCDKIVDTVDECIKMTSLEVVDHEKMKQQAN